MDPKINQLLDKVIRLADHLRREAEETEGYVRRSDKTSALRNINDSRDEVQDLVRTWQELTTLLSK